MKKEIQKIAIVRLSALGDIVNSAIVLQFIKSTYPDVKIDWVTEKVFAPILQNNPLIEKVHTVNLKKFKKEKSFKLLSELVKKLQNLGEYDLVIDMQGLIKSSIVSRLISAHTHGFDRNSAREYLAAFLYKSSSKVPYENGVVERNCFLVADALGFEITKEMILNKKPIFEVTRKFEMIPERKHVAFVIGASWESKIYPPELVAKICDELQELCYIIWGTEEERINAEWICDNSSFALLAPKMDLNELVSFISGMDLLIGNDTGPTHIAWAQNVPSITLLGPTTTRMIQETPKNVGIKSSSNVNILKINKNDFSIRDIPYDDVLEKAKELLYGL